MIYIQCLNAWRETGIGDKLALKRDWNWREASIEERLALERDWR